MTSATPHDRRNPVLPDPAALARAWSQRTRDAGWWPDRRVLQRLTLDPAPICRALIEEIAEFIQNPPDPREDDFDALRQLLETIRDAAQSMLNASPSEGLSREARALARTILDAVLRDIIVTQREGCRAAFQALMLIRHAGTVRWALRGFHECLELSSWVDAYGGFYLYLADRDWKRLREWDPQRGPLRPYLIRVIRHWAKRECSQPPGEGEIPLDDLEEILPATKEDILLSLEEREQWEALRRAWKQLSPRERELLVRYYFEDQTDAEIAEQWRVRRETVTRKRRAVLLKIRSILQQQGHARPTA